MQPQVQNLEQILADIDPAYSQSRNLYNQQITALPGQSASRTQGLEAARNNSFNTINDQAVGRGLAFSGIPLAEQARYLGEQYLPGLQKISEDEASQRMSLQQQLAALEQDRYNQALGIRTGQQDTLNRYLEAERQRQFDAEQARLNREAQARAAAASRAASAPGNPGSDFLGYIAQRFQQAGGAGNRNVSRQEQDRWANEWFLNQGIMDNAVRNQFWQLYNTQYNRSADPTKDWRYRR